MLDLEVRKGAAAHCHRETILSVSVALSATVLLQFLNACTVRRSDFNGDGKDDLVIGTPRETVDDIKRAGSVTVIMGGTPMSPVTFALHTGDFGTTPEPVDQFGHCMACGDFDADGFHDLAISVPNHGEVGPFSQPEEGMVAVIHGSPNGLDASRTSQLTLQTFGFLDGGASQLASAMAAGDFDDDGVADLAMGMSARSVDGAKDAGEVLVVHGIRGLGLTSASRRILFNQNSTSAVAEIAGVCEEGDRYGAELCALDFDGDGVDDLAIGIPGEDIESVPDAGSVNVVYGISGIGLAFLQNTGLYEGSPLFQAVSVDSGALADAAEAGDEFGRSLAAGSFDDDPMDFLVVGIPGKRVFGSKSAGAVGVLRFSEEGQLTIRYVCQDGPNEDRGVSDFAEDVERFGACVAAGDFDDDGRGDLAISVREDAVSPHAPDCGAVHVFTATSASVLGFGGNDDRLISQGGEFDDQPETGEFFGWSLAVGDFIAGSITDLAVSAVYDNVSGVVSAGRVHVIPGSKSGLTSSTDVSFTQASPGVPGVPERADGFGYALAPR